MSGFWKGRLVAVTGGSGFIGSWIVGELAAAGARVRASYWNHPPVLRDGREDGVEWVRADLRDAAECAAFLEGTEAVFHAAGAVAGAAVTASGPTDAIVDNLILTARVLAAAQDRRVERALIFGSSTGYPSADRPIREDEMWTAEPYPKYFGYGWMRRYLEKYGEFIHSQGVTKVAILRPSAVYGPRDNFDPKAGHVIPALIARARKHEDPFVVWGTGNEVRDFLYVQDLARGALLLLEKNASADPVNIGYGETVTIRQTVDAVLKAVGHRPRGLEFDATKPTTIPVRMVDTAKARRLLGFEPSVRFEDGIRRTVEWLQAAETQSVAK